MSAGAGVTYPRVIALLKEEVQKKGQRRVSRESGVALLSIQRYLKGQSEPTGPTLQKLADYFEVSVAWLRDEEPNLKHTGQELNRIYDQLNKFSSEMENYLDPNGYSIFIKYINKIEQITGNIHNATIKQRILDKEASREYLEDKMIPHLKDRPELLKKMGLIIVKGKRDQGFSPIYGDIKQGREYLIDEDKYDKYTEDLFEKVSPLT